MIFFQSWASIERIAITAAVFYILVIVFVRMSGKRSTAKMNNFDWIVTIAMGSMVATVVLRKQVTVADGVTGIVVLLILQFLATKFPIYANWFGKLIRAKPTLVYYDGCFLHRAMARERISEHEVLAAARKHQIDSMDKVMAVVLESHGELSVLPKHSDANPQVLKDVQHVNETVFTLERHD